MSRGGITSFSPAGSWSIQRFLTPVLPGSSNEGPEVCLPSQRCAPLASFCFRKTVIYVLRGFVKHHEEPRGREPRGRTLWFDKNSKRQ